MSARLPNSGAYFRRGVSGTPVTQPNLAAVSFCGLAKRENVAVSSYEAILGISNRFTSGFYRFFGWKSDGTFVFDTGGGAQWFGSGNEPPFATWFQWAVSHNTTSGVAVAYWKLIADTTWHSVSTGAGLFTPDQLSLGSSEWGDNAGNLSLSNVRCWESVKTGTQLMAEVNSASMLDQTGFAWWKMRSGSLGADSLNSNAHPLEIVDGVIDGTDSGLEAPADAGGAGGGGTTRSWEFDAESDPSGWFDTEIGGWFDPTDYGTSTPPVGGIPYTQTLTGGLTPSGTVREGVAKGLAGGLTPSGLARERMTMALGGALAPAGALPKTMARALAGGLTFTGIARDAVATHLGGSVTPTGTVAKRIAAALGGTLTPAGASTTHTIILRILTGTLSSSGTVGRSVATHLAGVLASAGRIGFAIRWTLTGALTPSGRAGLGYRRTLTGTLAPTGTATSRGVVAIILTGAVGFAGSVRRGIGRQLAGALAPTGVVRKQGGLTLGGSVAPTGTFHRTFPLLLTGAVGFAGSIGRQVRKGFRATLAFTGVIAEHLPIAIQTILRSKDASRRTMHGHDDSTSRFRNRDIEP